MFSFVDTVGCFSKNFKTDLSYCFLVLLATNLGQNRYVTYNYYLPPTVSSSLIYSYPTNKMKKFAIPFALIALGMFEFFGYLCNYSNKNFHAETGKRNSNQIIIPKLKVTKIILSMFFRNN